MEKITIDTLSDEYSKLVRQKSTVDGHEVEHVFYVAGGFGAGKDSDTDEGGEGFGGGGVAVPLGAYYSDGGRVRFHANPAVMVLLGAPVFLAGACIAKRMLTVLERAAR